MAIQALKEDIENVAIPENSLANDVFKKIRINLCNKLELSGIELSKDDDFFTLNPDHPLAKLFTQQASTRINFQDIRLQDLMLDKGAMITPLRISTPNTKISSTSSEEYKQTNYFQQLKLQIEAQNELSSTDKNEILQLLDVLQVASQELFSQTMSDIYLNKMKDLFQDCPQEWANLAESWEALDNLMKQHQLKQGNFSKKDVLIQRKAMDDKAKLLINTLKSMESPKAKQAIPYILKSLSFAKQTNDLHFQYADKPSYFFSNTINQIEKWGGRVALAASIIGILAVTTALALPALGIAVPAFVGATAAISTAVTIAVGLPLAFKKIGQSIYNGIKYNAAPTKGELINAALTGTSLLTAGATGLIGVPAFQGVGIATAAGALQATNNITKSGLGIANATSSHQFKQYKQRFMQAKDSMHQQNNQSDEPNDEEPNVEPSFAI